MLFKYSKKKKSKFVTKILKKLLSKYILDKSLKQLIATAAPSLPMLVPMVMSLLNNTEFIREVLEIVRSINIEEQGEEEEE